jgi:hypothetical protein
MVSIRSGAFTWKRFDVRTSPPAALPSPRIPSPLSTAASSMISSGICQWPKRAGEPYQLTAVVRRNVIPLETELLEDTERWGVPRADGRPEPCPSGRCRGFENRAGRLGGVATPMCALKQLIGDLRLLKGGAANDQPAVADEIAFVTAPDGQQRDPCFRRCGMGLLSPTIYGWRAVSCSRLAHSTGRVASAGWVLASAALALTWRRAVRVSIMITAMKIRASVSASSETEWVAIHSPSCRPKTCALP